MEIRAPTPADIFAVALTALQNDNTELILVGIFFAGFIVSFFLSGKRIILSFFIALGFTLIYALYVIMQYSSKIVY